MVLGWQFVNISVGCVYPFATGICALARINKCRVVCSCWTLVVDHGWSYLFIWYVFIKAELFLGFLFGIFDFLFGRKIEELLFGFYVMFLLDVIVWWLTVLWTSYNRMDCHAALVSGLPKLLIFLTTLDLLSKNQCILYILITHLIHLTLHLFLSRTILKYNIFL